MRTLQRVLLGAAVVLIGAANYSVFLQVPSDRVLGAVQRIFYFHVGSALACYSAAGVVFICAIGYLWTRRPIFDIVGEASGEVGFVFCTVVMATGMIWGHAAWNTWFSWEPRLVTFLLLWLIFLSFNLLRLFGDPAKIAPHSAVLGILGAITVPLVVVSVRILPQFSQLHPQVVAKGGLHPSMKGALFAAAAAVLALQFALLVLRVRLGLLARHWRV